MELVCTYALTRHLFNNPDGAVVIGVAQLEDGQEVTIKGSRVGSHPEMQRTYRLIGDYKTYLNKFGVTEKQFVFTGLIEERPLNRDGVIRLLADSPGITKHMAAKIYEVWQSESIDKIMAGEDPGVHRVTLEMLDAAKKFLLQWKNTRAALIDLMGLFSTAGIRFGIAKKCVEEWGLSAAEKVRANPFELTRLHGVGFATADKLYMEMGLDPFALVRQKAFLEYYLSSNGTGSTYYLDSSLRIALDNAVGIAARFDESVLELMEEERICRIHTDRQGHPSWDGELVWIGSEADAGIERSLAVNIKRLLASRIEWPAVDMARLSPHQAEKVSTCLSSPFAILGGGPGTGKTYCSTTVIRACIDEFGAHNVLVCAPTGKASVRSTEAMMQAGIMHSSMTIHRALKIRAGLDDFEHDFYNPLPYRVVIIDEPSMIPAALMASLLEAIANDCLVLMVGDVNQLPPVGRGCPLRDMLRAGLPAAMLTEVQRNSGTIVTACHSIAAGRDFEWDSNLDLAQKRNLVVLPTRGDFDAAVDHFRAVQSIVNEAGMDPWYDLQVIVPLNEKGQLSRVDFNARLRGLHACRIESASMAPGCKVICRKNGWVRVHGEADGSVTYVSNGDQGLVREQITSGLVIELNCPSRTVFVPTIKSDSGDKVWDLAYAITCHNSQGSEYPFVLVVSDPAGQRLCTREWWNTAISRAKVGCFVVGPVAPMLTGIKKTAINERVTFLESRLKEEL